MVGHVVITHYNEDLSWITNLKYPFTVLSKNGIPKDTPPNKGNEASGYLQYIIDNYDRLSDYTFFVHGHRTSWHHKGLTDEKINTIECSLPYYNINDFSSFYIPECPSTLAQFVQGYPALEDILGPIDVYDTSFRMGGQFYVHRDAIRSRSLDTYKALYEFLMKNTGQTQEDAILFERIWHFIFTHNSIDV